MFEKFCDVRVLLTFEMFLNISLYEFFRLFVMEFILGLFVRECTFLHNDRWRLDMYCLGHICSNCGHFENLQVWFLINLYDCTQRSIDISKYWEICKLINFPLFTIFTPSTTTG